MVILRLKLADASCHIGSGAFEDLLDPPGKPIGLIDSPDFRVTVSRTKQAGKLAVSVNALVIHFDHEDMVESRENVLQPRGEGIEMFDVKRRNAITGRARAVHRLAK